MMSQPTMRAVRVAAGVTVGLALAGCAMSSPAPAPPAPPVQVPSKPPVVVNSGAPMPAMTGYMVDHLDMVLTYLDNSPADTKDALKILRELQGAQIAWNYNLHRNHKTEEYDAGVKFLGYLDDAATELSGMPSMHDIETARQSTSTARTDALSGPPPGHVAIQAALRFCRVHQAYCKSLLH